MTAVASPRVARDKGGMVMPIFVRSVLLAAAAALSSGCAFHHTAMHWNGLRGVGGESVFVQTSTFYGAHLGIVMPAIGDTTIDAMIDIATARIAAAGGTNVRVVETESSNYWYAVPPLSFILSPVMTSVSIEYRPVGDPPVLLVPPPTEDGKREPAK